MIQIWITIYITTTGEFGIIYPKFEFLDLGLLTERHKLMRKHKWSKDNEGPRPREWHMGEEAAWYGQRGGSEYDMIVREPLLVGSVDTWDNYPALVGHQIIPRYIVGILSLNWDEMHFTHPHKFGSPFLNQKFGVFF